MSGFNLLLPALVGDERDWKQWIEEWQDRIKEKDKTKEREREVKVRSNGVVPSRLALRLFRFLDIRTLARMSGVNKPLRQIVSHDIIWRPLCLLRWSELEMATRVEEDPFPAWKSCFTRRIAVKETELKDIMEDRELGRCDWYTCSKGHLYMIGECRLPMFLARCPTCGETIGGRHHTMESNNRRLGAVYKEGLKNKKVLVDDVQSVVAGVPASGSSRYGSKDREEKRSQAEKEEKAQLEKQGVAMGELREWLNSAARNPDQILRKIATLEALDPLATFRVLFPFLASIASPDTRRSPSLPEVSKSFDRYVETLFKPLAKDQGTRAVLLGSLEEFAWKTSYPFHLFSSTVKSLQKADVFDSKSLKEWLSAGPGASWLVPARAALGYRNELKDFVKSL